MQALPTTYASGAFPFPRAFLRLFRDMMAPESINRR
jgi:hypothetical protein